MTIKRIAMISVHTSPLAPMGGKKTGGMNVYIRELALELAKRGISVDIFTRRSSMDEPEIDSSLGDKVRVVYLTAGPISALAPEQLFPHLSQFTARLMTFAMLQNVHYDIIYSHYWLSGWVAQKLKESWGTPFVQMFHTLGMMKERILSTDVVNVNNQRVYTELDVVAWADRVIAATPAEETQLMWLYRSKPRKISVVPPGVNTERFRPYRKEAAKRYLGFEKRHLLLFVGRIEPLKAVDSILQALALLKDRCPELYQEVCFAVVGGNISGNDPDLEDLKQLVAFLGVDDSVRFVGAKDQNELPIYYSAASVVIMPSDYESFGMVALEAMASGTPVIATQVGGLAHVVREGETGFLVPVREPNALAERICTLLEDEPLRVQFGRRASKIAKDYAWSKIADQLIAIFDEIIARRRRNRA